MSDNTSHCVNLYFTRDKSLRTDNEAKKNYFSTHYLTSNFGLIFNKKNFSRVVIFFLKLPHKMLFLLE